MTDHGPPSRLLICNHPVDDTRSYPLREQLLCCLDRLEELTRWLLSIILSSTESDDNNFKSAMRRGSMVMKTLIEEQRLLMHLRQLTLEQLSRQSELKQIQSASTAEAVKLGKYIRLLKEADLVLGNGIGQVQEKLEKIERSRLLNCEFLLNHSFLISRFNSVHCPLNWKPGDPRRPYPLDGQMRQGRLAQRLKILSLEDELANRGWRSQRRLALLDSVQKPSPSTVPGTPLCDVNVVTSQKEKNPNDSFGGASRADLTSATSLFSMDIFAERSDEDDEASGQSAAESDSSYDFL